ncbi:hypothetical protein JL722_4104 [Aureococcus anophagefferens]|nr:hypothetical protein JL722_4104 [Aureococcus anophagefferens]
MSRLGPGCESLGKDHREVRARAGHPWANHDNAVLIAEAGAIPLLVELLRDGTASGKEKSARALCSLAGNNRANQVQIVAAGAIPPLVELLRDGSAEAKLQAATALCYLAFNNDNKVAIARRRHPAARRAPTRRQRAAKTSAAVTLRSLADNNDASAVAIAAAVGFDALVELARRGVTVNNMTVVESAGIPAKRKAALVAGQLLETAAPRIRVTKYIKADIASYL